MNKKLFLTILFFILTTLNIFAFGSNQAVTQPVQSTDSQTVTQQTVSQPTTQLSTPFVQPEPARQELATPASGEPTRAEQVIRALAEAYPRQIDGVEYRDNDWAVLLRGTWYYYSDGRMLPQELLENTEGYSSQPFYNYPAELPAWVTPDSEQSERFRTMTANRSQNPPRRSPHFYDDLWRAHSQAESYERVKTIIFLGRSVLVHYMILENLSLVEEHILAAARTNPQVQAWINSIASLEGYSWRNIAETQSRSYHSYGLAIDIVPNSYGGRETYWLWTSWWKTDWWNVSYNERYHPPDVVIKIFERYGFIWGGKWSDYDTMHFEYRPEILILNGMPPDTRR